MRVQPESRVADAIPDVVSNVMPDAVSDPLASPHLKLHIARRALLQVQWRGTPKSATVPRVGGFKQVHAGILELFGLQWFTTSPATIAARCIAHGASQLCPSPGHLQRNAGSVSLFLSQNIDGHNSYGLARRRRRRLAPYTPPVL